jgi:predicted PurR-regulated permease PerM
MDTEFTLTQKRALAVVTVIAILFAAHFLHIYFMLIVVAAIAAHLFTPLFVRLSKRFGNGLSAALTLLAAIGSVIVPVGLLVLLAVVQISHMLKSVSDWIGRTDLGALGDKALRFVNDLIARTPFTHGHRVTPDSLRGSITTAAQHVGQWLLSLMQNAAGSVFGGVTAAILFLYVFISLLANRVQIRRLIGQLNPLGDDVTDLYLERMGAMVRATVRGQFVIALCQGIAGAASIYIAGFHEGFFIFAIVLTALSIIPLGGGIVTIPFGIGMILFGNVIGGTFVIVWHLLVVTNIDNLLRPFLVPREARLDPALMLLAVFAGIAMFGAWGIIVGPVVMIVIVTTINVYLAVFKGVPIEQPDQGQEKPKRSSLFGRLVRRLRSQQPATSTAE